MTFTKDAPFPDAQRTGRAFITPCCTAGSREFLVDGVLWLAFHVARSRLGETLPRPHQRHP